MQLLMREFRKRLPRLSKATYSKVTLEREGVAAFTLVASWQKTRGGDAGEHRSRYDLPRVATGSLHIRLTKKVCVLHDEFIREVLQERGI